MLSLSQFDQVYLYRPFVDFRKGIFGLASFVQEVMELDPFGKYLFLFCNRKKDRIKALYWDETGFALWYKCLEAERFKWPYHLEEDQVVVDVKKLQSFLLGLDPWQRPHKKLHYSSV